MAVKLLQISKLEFQYSNINKYITVSSYVIANDLIVTNGVYQFENINYFVLEEYELHQKVSVQSVMNMLASLASYAFRKLQ